MSSLLQNLIDRYPEAFDLLFFFVRLGLFVYIAVGLFPLLRKHVWNWSNSNTNAPRPLNAPSVYNTQQAAQYHTTAQPNSKRHPSPNPNPANHNHHAPLQVASPQPTPNAPRPLNAPIVYNTQQAAHYTSQTQPNSLRLPSPERFVAMLIRLYRASIINVRIGNCNVRIGCIPGLILLSFLLFLW